MNWIRLAEVVGYTAAGGLTILGAAATLVWLEKKRDGLGLGLVIAIVFGGVVVALYNHLGGG